MKKNFDGSEMEPEFLNTMFPVVLTIGTFGMGWGKYSGIPPFNFTEVCKLAIELIKNPDLKDPVLIPDFSTPCEIVNTDFKEMCKTGEGKFRVRGIIEDHGDDELIIRSIPYQTKLDPIKETIISLVRDKKLVLKDMIDESQSIVENAVDGKISKLDIRVRLILKPGTSKESVKKILYKSTSLEQSFGVSFEVVNDGENVHYNLKSMLLAWIDFKRDMKSRSNILKYKQSYKEFHELEPIINILSEKDSDKKLADLSRSCKNKKEMIEKLVKTYNKQGITDLQAEIIANWNYSNYTEESLNKFKKNFDEVQKKLKKYEKIINDDSLIDKEIIKDLEYGIETFGRDRVSILVNPDEEFVEDKPCKLIISEMGNIKKVPKDADVSEYNAYESKDRIKKILNINNKDTIIVFLNNGFSFNMAVNDIEDTPANGIGLNVIDQYDKFDSSTQIVAVEKKPTSSNTDRKLLFVTKYGLIKKSNIGNYMSPKAGLLIALNLKKDANGDKDELVDVLDLGLRDRDIILYSAKGRGLRINSKDIPATMRLSSGVIGMKLAKKDAVIGSDIIKTNKEYLVIVTDKGNGKKCISKNFKTTNRNSEGSDLIKLSDDEKILNVLSKNEDDIVTIYNRSKINSLLVENIKYKTLNSKGDKFGFADTHYAE